MIIKHYEIQNNLRKQVNCYLFYGLNTGLIEETINKRLKPIFSKNVFNYDESEILNNIDSFKESLLNKSFFEEDKLVIISRVTDKLLDLIKNLIEIKDLSLKIILKSNNLEKKSRLRNFFEKSKDLIVVPFYEDNYQTLLMLTQNFFRENKIKISSQNINYIVEKSRGNRISLKNDMQKIKIFSQNKSSIEFEDILRLTSSAENYNISELVDQCLVKNKKKTTNILNENISSTEDNILILKSFLYKLKRLKKLKIEFENKKNLDLTLSSFKPPIFWKDKDIIKQQLNMWSLTDIQLYIQEINNLEITIKKNSQISNQIINNFINERLEA